MSKNAEPGPASETVNEHSEEVVLTFDSPIAELAHNLNIAAKDYTNEQDQRTAELLKECLNAANQLFCKAEYSQCYLLMSDAVEYMKSLNDHTYLYDVIDIRRQLDKMTGGLKGRIATVSAMYFEQ